MPADVILAKGRIHFDLSGLTMDAGVRQHDGVTDHRVHKEGS
jgi:hypothetical protein